jgi:hypothetical protein
MTADKIDRTALEKLRADQTATHVAGSNRLVLALADASEVSPPSNARSSAPCCLKAGAADAQDQARDATAASPSSPSLRMIAGG